MQKHEPLRLSRAPDQEILDRVKRMETRETKFHQWWGFDPTVHTSNDVATRVTTDGEALYCSSPDARMGDLLYAAQQYDLTGDVKVYLNQRLVSQVFIPPVK